MPWMMAAAVGGSAIVGDITSAFGQSSANQANRALMLQNEQWQTQLSDTAMQRRVADLKAAGLNPVLAAGGPGAAMGSVTQPMMQNVGASGMNLGAQAASAVGASQQQEQVASNVGLQAAQSNAQDAKARADEADAMLKGITAAKAAGVDTDVQRQNIVESQSRVELQRLQGLQAQANTRLSAAQQQVAEQQIPEIQASIARLGAAQSADQARAQLDDIASSLKGLEIDQFNRMAPQLYQSAVNAAKQSGLDLARVGRQASVYQTPYVGAVAGYMDTIANWFHLGANISSSSSSVSRN